ncbi:type IV secretory system conjugative DNA transfer family protein [Nocardiopsis changdeensis]|uniref:Type IV secretion system DNA-binding domain-containing protein n=1 Tax=Nocardiopsis changdeensis TaxID=2831969 RepID=A0ABX8BK70_9ACTN|nr:MULTISPECIES: type IV secretion system DNA-binding domain-containing protein [Nocardiopsis]QUX22496.1 type IV secretion system DNA-binding domain-containing protein [Nocardiopsis changdeensis]QYX38438.1 type IV secretion system DNA-binding domain-containing protein [Nocardiopsis sp. MT53]
MVSFLLNGGFFLVLGMIPLIGALVCAVVLGVRLARHHHLSRQARTVEILPPPEATMEDAIAFWQHVMGLLKPGWSRWLLQPHIALEILASTAGVRFQLWVPGTVPPGTVERAVTSAWPGATTSTRQAAPGSSSLLLGAYSTGGRLRLGRAEVFPLRTRFDADPYRPLLGAMGDLAEGEHAMVRITARPVTGLRAARARQAAARLHGHTAAAAQLIDALDPTLTGHRSRPPLLPGTGDDVRAILNKASSSRLACGITYILTTTHAGEEAKERLRGLAHGVGSAFAAFTSGSNHLDRGYMFRTAWWAVHRFLGHGLLLSTAELAAIAHLPTDISVPGLVRAGARPAAPTPAVPRGGEGTKVIGDSDVVPDRPVAVGVAEGRQHTHILGKTGSGKSTLLARLVLQDAVAGRAALVIDPRGDLITDVLARLPESAVGKVVLFDPDDSSPPPRLNFLEGGDPDFVSDTVVGIFRRIYDQYWGPRTDDILRATTLTLTRAGDPNLTLGDIPRLLADDGIRAQVLAKVTENTGRDPALEDFWGWYAGLTVSARSSVTGPILNKLRSALLRKWVRQVVASGASTVHLPTLFDSGHLVLLRLPKGRLGEDTSSLIGSFALAATWQAVTARIRTPEHRRKDLSAYIDEAQNFLNLPGSLEDMLAEARGYRLGLTLAHQELGQLPGDLRKALSANARTKIYFSASPDDAASLQQHTLPVLGAYDLTHLGAYQAVVRPLVGAKEQGALTVLTRPLPPGVKGRATKVRTVARRHGPGAAAGSDRKGNADD